MTIPAPPLPPTTQTPMATLPPSLTPEQNRALLANLVEVHARVSSGKAKPEDAPLPLLVTMIRHHKASVLTGDVRERLVALNAEYARLTVPGSHPEPTDGPREIVATMIMENTALLHLGPSSSSAAPPKPSDVGTVGDETEDEEEEEEEEPRTKRTRAAPVGWWANLEAHPLAQAVGVASGAVKTSGCATSPAGLVRTVFVDEFNASAHLAWLEHLVASTTSNALRLKCLSAMVDFFKAAQPNNKVRSQTMLALATGTNYNCAHCVFCAQPIAAQPHSISVCSQTEIRAAARKDMRVTHQYHAACASFIQACDSAMCFCTLHDAPITTRCFQARG
jgi:hypothetical protein